MLGYGNYLGAPWEWANAPEFRDFVSKNFSSHDDMLTLQLAFDVPGASDFPERGAFEAARELGLRVTTHAACGARRPTPRSRRCTTPDS